MCTRVPNEEIYEFFEGIVDYIKKANDSQHDDASFQYSSNCDSFYDTMESSFNDKQIAISVCKELVKLHKSLDINNKTLNNCNGYKKDCGFFNYWVNYKISKNIIDESNSIEIIYNGLESQFSIGDDYNMTLNFICDINKNELDKMNILYSLYEKYSKLKAIINTEQDLDKNELATLSSQCCTDYNQASYMCNDDNDNGNSNNREFCKNLKRFRTKFESLYENVNKKAPEYSHYFKSLPKCGNNKIVTNALIGSMVGIIPLFGVLYKFTPMGQVLRSKIGMLNKDTSNNDEELTKMSLMEQENEPLNFQQGTYNIKYQSL
ncbi:Plasmodium vivax Vir protein, putative [Plasmodium vivax]|nr:Plasmodium vivax Vir protein, putative [Plasmodium vivax]